MSKANKLSICLIPDGGGQVRTIRVRPKFMVIGLLGFSALVAGLAFFAYHSYASLSQHTDQSAELEALRYTNASQQAQLDAFAERVTGLDIQLANLMGRDIEVKVLKNEINRQLGLEPEGSIDDLLPQLTATISWVDHHNGVGGSDQLASALSATAVAGSSRDLIRGMHRDLDRLMMDADDAGRYLNTMQDSLSGARSILASTPLFLPVNGRISAAFGRRPSPFDGMSVDMHRGLDIPAPIGTLIRVPANGTVLSVGPSGGYGLLVTVDHGYGLVTRYAHLSSSLVEVGDKVSRGQGIARTGNSGRSTGPTFITKPFWAEWPSTRSKYCR